MRREAAIVRLRPTVVCRDQKCLYRFSRMVLVLSGVQLGLVGVSRIAQ